MKERSSDTMVMGMVQESELKERKNYVKWGWEHQKKPRRGTTEYRGKSTREITEVYPV